MTDSITPLHQLHDGQLGDFFALLASKDVKETKQGKPYHQVTFCDNMRQVSFPIWNDATHSAACRKEWRVGEFFKLRAVYRDTEYGPQLEIHRIRPAEASDAADGFDPLMCAPRSRFEPEAMFDELMAIAAEAIADESLRELVVGIYQAHREELLLLPAAMTNHHPYLSGYLEHVLNVTRHTRLLAVSYVALYSELQPPIDASVAVAGAMLHDIGKLRELATGPAGATYTPAGSLIGHILQGRDMLREAAAGSELEAETLLRLEHIIVSHQRLPEWGAPKPPMFPEALIIHYADDLDAKLQMMVAAITEAPEDAEFTSKRNPMGQAIYRGPVANVDEKSS